MSNETEKSVLAMFYEGADIPGYINEGMFSYPKNRIVFSALKHLKADGKKPDLIVLNNYMVSNNLHEQAEAYYLAEISSMIPSTANSQYYIEQFLEAYKKRELKKAAVAAIEKLDGDVSVIAAEVIAGLIPLLQSLTDKNSCGRKTDWTAAELRGYEFPDIQWIVPDLVATGLSVLAGAPKVKKSWLALSMAIAVASGGYVMGKIPAQKNGVLYLALEDNGRRLQDRMNKLGMGYPENLHFFTEWKTGTAGLKSYLRQHREIRFCVIDTWGIFSPHRDHNDYSESTLRAHELQNMASELGIAILIIHHVKKGGGYGEAGDWMDSILGSTGLSGAADSIIVLRRKRGEEKAELLATGRDILEKDMILLFDLDCGGWTIEGNKQDIQEGETQQEIFDWLKENGAHTPKEIYKGMKEEGYEGSPVTLRVVLSRMADKGTLQKNGHTYFVSPSSVPTVYPGSKVTESTETLPTVTVTRANALDVPKGIAPEEYRECYDTAYSAFINEGFTADEADRKAREEIREFIAGYDLSRAAVSSPVTPDEEIDF
jgi:hypothetical protein